MSSTNNLYPQAPCFTSSVPPMSAATSQAVATRGTPATLNLDDIFGDCFFTPKGDAVFLSDQVDNDNEGAIVSTESEVATNASRLNSDGVSVPVQSGGGIQTTNLLHSGQNATTMGQSSDQIERPNPIPFSATPQKEHHLGYISTDIASKTRRRQRPNHERKMSEQQKVERRERNREHAKRSRIRKKFLLESLQQSVSLLKEENEKLRHNIRHYLGDEKAEKLLSKKNLEEQSAAAAAAGLIADSANDANKVLDDPDFSFIKALQTAQQNFVVTDPSLPDNPIVYATQGFLNLTGYTLDQVLGRNCRFLQGPETDPKAVEKIRKSIEDGSDMSVCLLNYRADGSTFWNQFFIAALRDAAGNITNYVGVQCKVSDQYAATIIQRQEGNETNENSMGQVDPTDAPHQ